MGVYYKSEINRRSVNEDSFCDLKMRINHEAAVHVMCVADGMGGLTQGEHYSKAAVRLLNEKLLKVIMDDAFKGSPLDEQMEQLNSFCHRVFQEINQELYTGGLNAGVQGGTTLSVLIRFWHSFIVANCGDSPVYYMKDGFLKLASDIQNAAWRMVQEGKTDEGSLIYYQNKSRLLQYLGRREAVSPFVLTLKEEEADCFLLGTDGAFGSLDTDQIGRLILDNPNRQKLLFNIFEASRNDGEEDNQTAVFYEKKPKRMESFGASLFGRQGRKEDGVRISTANEEERGEASVEIQDPVVITPAPEHRKDSLRARLFRSWLLGGRSR